MDIGSKEKISHLKLGALNYECLREALRLPDTRIRFPKNIPEIRPPRLIGIRIVGQKGNSKSYFHDFIIGFSNNLTCIVGPRGSGKSALIDAIRYVMGYNRTLSDIDKVRQQVLDRQKYTLQATKIQLLYERADSSIHNLSATFDEKESYNTTVFDLNNNQINISDVERSGEYPLNLYGWNELELLGEDPRSQRESLDRFIKELKPLKEKREGLYNQRKIASKKCIDSVLELDTYFQPGSPKNLFIRVKELETEFNKLNTPEMEGYFKELDLISQKLGLIEAAKTAIGTLKEKLEDVKQIDLVTSLEKFPLVENWGREFLEKTLMVGEINDLILTSSTSIANRIDLTNEIIIQEEAVLIEKKTQTSKGIREAIGDDKSISADLRNNAKKRMDQAKVQLEAYKKELENFEKCMAERESVLAQIESVNSEIYEVRRGELDSIASKIQVVNDDGFKISLSLVHGNDRSEFLEVLENNACKIPYDGQWKKKKIPVLISHKATPIEFGRIILENLGDKLVVDLKITEDDVVQTYSISKAYATSLVANCNPFETLSDINVKKVDRANLERVFTLQATKYDDEFYIELNDKPIQYCSPGQRCSAMLPIVTLTSDAPIIIDQPEDNLDNRLVSKAIFKILSKLKETRQIIVATHNPNILVSGDAEQVIVLKGSGAVENFGSIDSPPIIKNVIELMEGGREAFEKRRLKYEIA